MRSLVRDCPECGVIIEYNNYDKYRYHKKMNSSCTNCKKNKELPNILSKKCSNKDCFEIIEYKSKYDCASGLRDNTICQKCKNQRLSILHKEKGGFLHNKSEKEKLEIQIRTTASRLEFYKNNPDKLEQLQKKQSYNKWFNINGLNCQGNCERLYIEGLIKENKELPIKARTVCTKYGFYSPDFEFEDEYIEVKSTYTYSLLKKINNKQYLKIKETANLLKPVRILVIDIKSGNVLKEELLNTTTK
jgi:hypothetical protein